MSLQKIFVLFVCYSFYLLLGHGSLMAAGMIVIDPRISIGFQNNSNYWRAEESEISVNTYDIKPGLAVKYDTAKTKAKFDGVVIATWYDDQDDPPDGVRSAGDDDYVGANIVGRITSQLTDRINLGFNDRFYVTRDPARSDRNSNSVDRDKYTINFLEPRAKYEFSEMISVFAAYRNTYTNYEKDLEDSVEHRGLINVNYSPSETQTAYLGYSVWDRSYDQESSDYTSNLINLNYRYQFGYFSFSCGGGYHHRTFDQNDLDSMDLFSWRVELKGQDPGGTRESSRSFLDLSVGQEMNDDGTGDSYFTASFVRLDGGYRLLERLVGSISARFQNSDYEASARNEDRYRILGTLDYQFSEYISVEVYGGYENRDSNIEGNSFDDTMVGTNLKFVYTVGGR